MKKTTQYSDKYGKVVTEGEVVEERKSPGVTFAAPAAKEAAPVAEAEKAPKAAPKAEKKKAKKADDKE